jgi:hypothetical protein
MTAPDGRCCGGRVTKPIHCGGRSRSVATPHPTETASVEEFYIDWI